MEPTTDNNPSKISVEYFEHSLEDVIRFFVNSYRLNEGKITDHKAYVDTASNKVIIKATIKTPTKPDKED